MQIQFIQKPTDLVYVWVFFPTFDNLPEEIIHKIEHKLFFNKDLSKLTGGNHLFSNHLIDANGDAFYSGIRLQFFLIPELLTKLLSVLENITKQDLPNWTQEESMRFKKELEEDDSFMRLSLYYKEKCLNLKKSKFSSDLKKTWKNKFDFANTRILIVGNLEKEKQWKGWEKISYNKIDTTFSEQKYIDWYGSIEKYNYNIFFSLNTSVENYVCMKIMQNILYEDLTKQYVESGRSYEVTLRNRFEQDFIVSAFDILTSDTNVEKPKLKSNVSKQYFEQILKRSIFEELSDNDEQAYGCFPVVGFMPDDVKQAFEKISYSQFSKFYKQKLKELSIYWL